MFSHITSLIVVPPVRLELTHLAIADFKSAAAANYATGAVKLQITVVFRFDLGKKINCVIGKFISSFNPGVTPFNRTAFCSIHLRNSPLDGNVHGFSIDMGITPMCLITSRGSMPNSKLNYT